MEDVRYLTPSIEDHGHWIQKEDEAPRMTKTLMKRATDPVDHSVWVALEREIRDEAQARRRLRGKTSVRKLQGDLCSEDEEEEGEKIRLQVRLRQIIEDEMKALIEGDEEMIIDSMEAIARLKKMAEGMEEQEEVLQTKIISPNEVWQHWEEWEAAAKSEIAALLEEKEAFEAISPEEAEKLKKEAEERGVKLECIPSKVVWAKKPIPGGHKCKVRWVICGNFEQKQEHEETYTGGADATSFRVMVWVSSREGWVSLVLDARTAFLNADLVQEDQTNFILVVPPVIFVKKGCLPAGYLYRPKKAVYGLRRSPRLWGLHRDDRMKKFVIELKKEGKRLKFVLRPMNSEANLWRVLDQREAEKEDEGGERASLCGLVMTYVDDIYVTAPKGLAEAIAQVFRSTWTTSAPELAGEVPIRFLGMEIRSVEMDGSNVWYIAQENYLKNMVSKLDVHPKKLPITKDQATMPPDLEKPELSQVRKCQKVVGELLWALSRTRPDLMFCLSRMGSNVTRATEVVLETALQVQGYLKRTTSEGLKYKDDGKMSPTIRVFSDASYAPGNEESQGAFIIFVNDCPVFWRAGRQQFITLSTAEAELAELVEAMNAGESVGVIVDELYGRAQRLAYSDSQSALAILASDGGSWRTRHLRTRASYARQSVLRGDWGVVHIPGERMVADIGTKALPSTRVDFLKKEMNMAAPPEEKEEEEEKERKEEEGKKEEGPKKEVKEGSSSVQIHPNVIKAVAIAAVITAAKGQDEEEGEGTEAIDLTIPVLIFTVLIVLSTLGFQTLWKEGV